jgi:hypothetical protein
MRITGVAHRVPQVAGIVFLQEISVFHDNLKTLNLIKRQFDTTERCRKFKIGFQI